MRLITDFEEFEKIDFLNKNELMKDIKHFCFDIITEHCFAYSIVSLPSMLVFYYDDENKRVVSSAITIKKEENRRDTRLVNAGDIGGAKKGHFPFVYIDRYTRNDFYVEYVPLNK